MAGASRALAVNWRSLLDVPANHRPPPSRSFPAKERPASVGIGPCETCELAEAAKDDPARARILENLAAIDPAGALARLAARPPKDPDLGDMVRQKAARALASRDVDAALEVVETISEGIGRTMSLLELCDRLPDTHRQRKLELLAEALVQVRGIKEPEMRLCWTGLVAERLLDLGERERGERLLRAELDTARRLGTAEFAGYARGAFAEELGQVDLPAALDLIKDLQDPDEFNRHHGNLAHELAGKRPEDAERVLKLIKPPGENEFSQHDHYAVRVCYRMATVDLPRAEQIAMSIDEMCQRAYALGVMAAALTGKDRDKARALLLRAFDILEKAKPRPEGRTGPHEPATIAGCLLALAEKLDAERRPLLQECLWRTVALVPPATNDRNGRWYAVEGAATAALWLAEYDAALARDLLARVDPESALSSRAYVPALALVAMDRLDAFLAKIPDEGTRNRLRLQAAAILPLSGEDLRRQIHHVAGLWLIDVEDLFW
jgi:hypothetical protein